MGPSPYATGDEPASPNDSALAQTMVSRTMRRLKGTVGRVRSSFPSIPLVGQSGSDLAGRVDPYPLSKEDLAATPAAYEYGTASGGAAVLGPSVSAGPGSKVGRASGLMGSIRRSGAQTVREAKRSLRAALPIAA